MAEISRMAVIIAGIIILVVMLFLVFGIYGSGSGVGEGQGLAGSMLGSWLR